MVKVLLSPETAEKVWVGVTRPFNVVTPLERQVLLIAKQPAERLRPLSAVLVAPEESLMEPPEMVRPFEEESPPALVEEIPPAKVEVALLPLIVVVAVAPTSTPLIEESKVEEAKPLKSWRPVQVLGLVRLSPATTAPVFGEMVRVLSAF